MSYYREVYLKSDEWKELRSAKLKCQRNRCQLCGLDSDKMDVHHVKYKRLFDVQLVDLKVLCRDCHDKVHALLDKYPKMKTLKRSKIWILVKQHLFKEKRIAMSPQKELRRERRGMGKRMSEFGRLRTLLFEAGKIYKWRMPWHDCMNNYKDWPKSEDEMLAFYMAQTGKDPRKESVLQ